VKYDAVIFVLLTALIDSWSLWNDVAGSASEGMTWRRRYLEITYGCGPYRPYETVGLPVFWHNRVGLPPRDDARPDHLEPTLDKLADLFARN
jgi:hypothetical protein